MVGQRRGRGLRAWTALSALGLWVLAAMGCGQTTTDEADGPAGAGSSLAGAGGDGTSGAPALGGVVGSGGSKVVIVGVGGVGPIPPPGLGGTGSGDTCTQTGGEGRIFEEQAVHDDAPAVLELFTWTTPEQIAELRAGAPLLNRTERAGKGPGYAFVRLAEFAKATNQPEFRRLAELLLTEPFARARFAWPNPWATRMGWPGESYGGELVRIELRAEAYLVRFQSWNLSVVDTENRDVPIESALATPERIAGIYFVKDHAADDRPLCDTFDAGGGGYREFIVANEKMVAEWSLATDAIRSRLEDDIHLLEAFRDRVQSCSSLRGDLAEWQRLAFCRFSTSTDVRGAYYYALAMPNENYVPEPPQLARMIETLRGDLFVPDPFVVTLER